MNDVLLTPEQEKFFSTYINKSKLLGLKQKIDLEFANAFRGFKDADNIAMPMLTNLPRYGKGTAEATTKSELFTRYEAIQSATLAKHSSHGKAVAACDKGKADLDRLIADIQKLQTKALQDSTPAPQRIILLKQDAHIKLVQARAEFTAKSDVIKNKIEAAAPGVVVLLPVISEFNTGFEALRVRITEVAETGQTVDQATKTLAAIAADTKTLVDAKLLALNAFSGSEALATLVADAKLQAAIQSQLSILNSNIGQMTTWEVPDAKGFAAEENILSKRINDSFYKTTAKNKGEADAITLERNTILEEITALNARASQAIQAKKFAFGQLYRDVTARFETVERAFQNIDDTSFAKGQAAPIIQVLSVTRTAINDLNGYNTDALVAARKLVDDAAVIVTDAQRIAEINRQINDDLGAIRLDVDFAISSKNPLNDRFVAHKKEYETLAKDWRSMLVPDAVKAVKTFIETVKADLAKNQALLDRRAAANAALGLAKADLKLFDGAYSKMLKAHGEKAKPYSGQLIGDIAMVEGWIGTKLTVEFYNTIDSTITRIRRDIGALMQGLVLTEGKSDDEIFAEARELQKELVKIVDETTFGLALGHETIDPLAVKSAKDAVEGRIAQLSTRADLLGEASRNEQEAAEAAERKRLYLVNAKEFVKSTNAERKDAVDGSGFKDYGDEVQTQIERVENSIKLVGKGGSVAAADSELTFVKNTIDSIRKRGGKSRKKKLDQIGVDWAKAVKEFDDKCVELLTSVKTFTDAQGSNDAYTALHTAVNAVAAKLDPGAFDAVAARFDSPGEGKAAREQALQKVRYFNELLLKDPVMQKCVLNPFKVRDFLGPVSNRLRQIELNVLRGV